MWGSSRGQMEVTWGLFGRRFGYQCGIIWRSFEAFGKHLDVIWGSFGAHLISFGTHLGVIEVWLSDHFMFIYKLKVATKKTRPYAKFEVLNKKTAWQKVVLGFVFRSQDSIASRCSTKFLRFVRLILTLIALVVLLPFLNRAPTARTVADMSEWHYSITIANNKTENRAQWCIKLILIQFRGLRRA